MKGVLELVECRTVPQPQVSLRFKAPTEGQKTRPDAENQKSAAETGGMVRPDSVLPAGNPDITNRNSSVFEPQIEREIRIINQTNRGSALDLDSGKTVDMPAESPNWSTQQQGPWMRQNHIELAASFADDRWQLITKDLALKALNRKQWVATSIAELRYALASGIEDANSPVEVTSVSDGYSSIRLRPALDMPMTFGFLTAAGNPGLLQIEPPTEGRGTLQIRYRHIQTGLPLE